MANDLSFDWDKFYRAPIVGIARGYPPDTVLRVAAAYQASGLTTLEVTMNSPEVGESIGALRRKYPALNVGAGTVCSLADFDLVVEAGAQFIVTPIVAEEVITAAVKQGIPVFPGAYTPTEIYRAWALGASAVKVFPASQLGVRYIKDVLGPLNEIKLLPTGGVSGDNIQDFFAAGVVGVGMGSSLLSKSLIAAGDFTGLEAHFREILEKISIRSKSRG